MHVMLTNQFPPHMVKEVAKVFLGELPKRPKFVKHLFQFVSAADNVKTYTFYEIDDAKVKEGLAYLNQVMAKFIPIEGYKMRIEPVWTPEEALPLYGFKTT